MARTDQLVATSAPSSPPWEGPCTPAPAQSSPHLPNCLLKPLVLQGAQISPGVRNEGALQQPHSAPRTASAMGHLARGTCHSLERCGLPLPAPPPALLLDGHPCAAFFLERSPCFYVKGCTFIISILNNIRKDQNAGPPTGPSVTL